MRFEEVLEEVASGFEVAGVAIIVNGGAIRDGRLYDSRVSAVPRGRATRERDTS
jgi:hypothetical protein